MVFSLNVFFSYESSRRGKEDSKSKERMGRGHLSILVMREQIGRTKKRNLFTRLCTDKSIKGKKECVFYTT